MKIVRLLGGYLAAVAVVTTIVMGGQAQATEKKPEVKTEQKKAPSKTEVKKTSSKEAAYSYVAQPGDAYAQLVRKAVQTYGIQNKKEIGQARILAIETIASEKAGWPLLNEGQIVSFKQSQIKAWVDEAMKLPAEDVAAWQTYVPYVNFDTRNIGE
ncbi:hypothetical protein GX865_01685 [Candidatus Saccharibacteria bacterium]|jgi:hypothetical protein|nr:hypothetical protein [Candidatus Saccharibacteria bacterium]